jgi:UPF0271 protein
VIVLDTSAFIAGYDPLSASDEQFTVPTVMEELIVNSLPWIRFNAAVESGKLKVRIPKERSMHVVKESSKTLGDVLYLSAADLDVLALALELKDEGFSPSIVTDDYSIQNVANHVGLGFSSLITYGIRYRLHWILYCPACHHKYPADYKLKNCRICGSVLKRKPLARKLVDKAQLG